MFYEVIKIERQENKVAIVFLRVQSGINYSPQSRVRNFTIIRAICSLLFSVWSAIRQVLEWLKYITSKVVGSKLAIIDTLVREGGLKINEKAIISVIQPIRNTLVDLN